MKAFLLGLLSSAVFAGFSGSVGVTSEYIFRGIPQNTGTALQGSMAYESDFGLGGSVWTSNWEESNEVDFSLTYTKKFESMSLVIGAIFYHYPEKGSSDYNEYQIGLRTQWANLDIYSMYNVGEVSHYGEYFNLNRGFELSASEKLSLNLAVGYMLTSEDDEDYLDYRAALQKEYNQFNYSFYYSNTDREDKNDDRFGISVDFKM